MSEQIDRESNSQENINNPLGIFQENFLEIIKSSQKMCSVSFPKDILWKILITYNKEAKQYEIAIRTRSRREPFNRIQNKITEKISENETYCKIAIYKDDPFEVEFKVDEKQIIEFKKFMESIANGLSDFVQIKDVDFTLTTDKLKEQLWLTEPSNKWTVNAAKNTQERTKTALLQDHGPQISDIFSQPKQDMDMVESLLLTMPEDEKLELSDIVLPKDLKDRITDFLFDIKHKAWLQANWWRIKNILMQWPPWVGKTEIVRYIASQEWITVYTLGKDDYQTALAWEWQKNLQRILISIKMRAEENNEHAIIFMDEVEWIIKNRFNWKGISIDNDEASVFLKFLDWIKKNINVTIISATNAPITEIDSAFLRAPRCEDIWILNKPDKTQIKEAIKVHMWRKNKIWNTIWSILFDSTQELINTLWELMNNFNYSDIEAVITNACNIRYKRMELNWNNSPVSEMEIRSAINKQKKKIENS